MIDREVTACVCFAYALVGVLEDQGNEGQMQQCVVHSN